MKHTTVTSTLSVTTRLAHLTAVVCKDIWEMECNVLVGKFNNCFVIIITTAIIMIIIIIIIIIVRIIINFIHN